MIYLDTSALVKLVVAEDESNALLDWLNARRDTALATSIVGRIELVRVASRANPPAVAAAHRLLSTIDTLILSDEIANLAATIAGPDLRTLDAIHLATAQMYRAGLDVFCAYDRRLLTAAKREGLPIASPGR